MLLKNISDIRINDGIWSIERYNIINLDLINEDLRTLAYTGNGRIIDNDIEKSKFPPFAQVFYFLIYQLRKISSEELFFSRYLEWIDAKNITSKDFVYQGKTLSIEGLQGRLLRTYPSLIRDLHFYYLLLESKQFDKVNYSLSQDFYDGIDISILYLEKSYGISIHINTKRGCEYKILKQKRHNYENIEEIIFNVNFTDLNKIGNFYLLGETHIKTLLDELTKP
jgi:hypothetical protein